MYDKDNVRKKVIVRIKGVLFNSIDNVFVSVIGTGDFLISKVQ